MAGICVTWQWSSAHTRNAQSGCPSTVLNRGQPYATQSAVFQPFQLYGGAYSFGGLAESHPIPPPSVHGGEGSPVPNLVPSDDTVDSESMVGIKPGDGTCSAEQFVAHFPHLSWVHG